MTKLETKTLIFLGVGTILSIYGARVILFGLMRNVESMTSYNQVVFLGGVIGLVFGLGILYKGIINTRKILNRKAK